MATGGLVDNTITIITANIGCSTKRDKSRVFLKRLVQREKPSLLFLQESKLQFIARSYKFPRQYASAIKGEDRFLYDNDKLSLKMIDSGEITTVRDKKFKDFASYLVTENINMALVNTFKKSRKDPNILCVSWHGPHIQEGLNSEKKMKILEVMLRFVKTFSEKYGLPFIIGGDFNLELAGAKKVLKSFNDMKVHDYDAGRRPNRVDYFISSESLTLIDVHVAPWNYTEADEIFDHDPIMAKLQVDSSKDFLKSTKDESRTKRKREDTANVKEESEKKLIKTDIAKEYMEELEEKINKSIEKYSKGSSEETKKKLKKEIREEFAEKMEEFKNN